MTTPEAPGRHAPSGGLRIHYQDTGSGPPLLVLNGWTGSGLMWPAEWTSPLEQDFRLLRVCNRGTGWSDLPDEPFTIADMAADALAVLDDRGIARAHLFGLSMGGMIAQHLALHHRDRVDRVVLAATAPPMPDMVLPETDVFSRLMTPPEQGASRDEFVASIWKKIVGPGFDERGADVLARLVESAVDRPTPLNVIMLQMQAVTQRVGDVRDIAVPTLVLHGGDDPLLPVDNGRRLGELIPDAVYVELPGVGHLIPWEAPDRTAALMREFLASARVGTG